MVILMTGYKKPLPTVKAVAKQRNTPKFINRPLKKRLKKSGRLRKVRDMAYYFVNFCATCMKDIYLEQAEIIIPTMSWRFKFCSKKCSKTHDRTRKRGYIFRIKAKRKKSGPKRIIEERLRNVSKAKSI